MSTATTSANDRLDEIRAALEADRSAMTVVLARKLGVPEVQVIRAMPPEATIELVGARWEELVRAFEPLGDVHVVASNGSVTLECFGSFGNFSTWGDYFNVQTKSLDMHIRTPAIASAFAVRKPSHMDNVPTLSFQFFNHSGDSAFKVFLTFGGKQPSENKQQQFDDLVAQFRIG